MTTQRLNDNSIKGLILFILFTAMSLKLCTVTAQSAREILDTKISEKVRAWDDSVRKLNPKKFPVYIGGELSVSVAQYTLKSNIAQLAGMHTSYMGTNVGGMVGSPIGKLKANVGMYYSDASVHYTINMLQGSVSSSVYFLRLKKVTYHTFEPYASVGFSYQQTKFYGYYLPGADNSATQPNYSSTDQPLLGQTGTSQVNVATGVEYQLESCNKLFIHLFAEISYGAALTSSASNQAFSGTTPSNPMMFSVGVNFGTLK